MIHLDTNYLIRLLVKGSPQARDVDNWLAAGETLATSAVAWTEFLNSPVTPSSRIRLAVADHPLQSSGSGKGRGFVQPNGTETRLAI